MLPIWHASQNKQSINHLTNGPSFFFLMSHKAIGSIFFFISERESNERCQDNQECMSKLSNSTCNTTTGKCVCRENFWRKGNKCLKGYMYTYMYINMTVHSTG